MNYDDALKITAAGTEAKLTGKTNLGDADKFQNTEKTAVICVCSQSGFLFCFVGVLPQQRGSWLGFGLFFLSIMLNIFQYDN